MKILWFVSSNLTAGSYRTFWVSCLLKELSKFKEIELGICFLTTEKNAKPYVEEGISYFPVDSHKSFLRKVCMRLLHNTKGANNFNDYLSVIGKFNPDLLNIFGSENEYAKIIPHVKCKSVIHIQGILSPLIEYWHLPDKNNTNVFYASKLIHLVLGIGLFHSYYKIKKNAQREMEMLAFARYIFGRTEWDKRIMKIAAPNATYFHIDEVIRDDFFKAEWQYTYGPTINLVTIIGDEIYKGYDLILKTAAVLEKHHFDFKWTVFGLGNKSESVGIIENMLKMKHSDKIQLKGHADARDIVAAMKNAHLYVHSSKIENSPNSVCEAMLAGLPVVAAYTGGIPSIVKDKINGLLFPNMDFYALASIIMEYSAQPGYLKQLSDNARQEAFKRHDKEKIIKDLINTYRIILDGE